MKLRRDDIEKVVYGIMDEVDDTGSNRCYYENLFREMSDLDFIKFTREIFRSKLGFKVIKPENDIAPISSNYDDALNFRISSIFESTSFSVEMYDFENKICNNEVSRIAVSAISLFDLVAIVYNKFVNVYGESNFRNGDVQSEVLRLYTGGYICVCAVPIPLWTYAIIHNRSMYGVRRKLLNGREVYGDTNKFIEEYENYIPEDLIELIRNHHNDNIDEKEITRLETLLVSSNEYKLYEKFVMAKVGLYNMPEYVVVPEVSYSRMISSLIKYYAKIDHIPSDKDFIKIITSIYKDGIIASYIVKRYVAQKYTYDEKGVLTIPTEEIRNKYGNTSNFINEYELIK